MRLLRILAALTAAVVGLALGCAFPRGARSLGANSGQPEAAQTGMVTIQIDLSGLWRHGQSDESVYRTQYVDSDVQELVVGLYDTTTGTPTFGQEIASSSTTPAPVSTSAPDYHEAIVGTYNPGNSYYDGGALVVPTSIPAADRTNFRRCLYSDEAKPLVIATTNPFNFTNVPADATGTRYIAFAAALSTASFAASSATDSYVIGFASASVPAFAAGGTAAAGTLVLTLNRNTYTLTIPVTINKGSSTNPAKILQMIIGIVATQSAAAQELTLGYYNLYPTPGATTEDRYNAPPVSPTDYWPAVYDNTAATGFTDKTTWSRYFWVDKAYNSTYTIDHVSGTAATATTSATLTNIPRDLLIDSGDYRVFAIAFDGTGGGKNAYSTVTGSGSEVVKFTGATNAPTITFSLHP